MPARPLATQIQKRDPISQRLRPAGVHPSLPSGNVGIWTLARRQLAARSEQPQPSAATAARPSDQGLAPLGVTRCLPSVTKLLCSRISMTACHPQPALDQSSVFQNMGIQSLDPGDIPCFRLWLWPQRRCLEVQTRCSSRPEAQRETRTRNIAQMRALSARSQSKSG